MKHYLWLFLLPCFLVSMIPAAHSAPFDKTFSLSVQNESIEKVLSVFARQMGYVARFDQKITGQLSGSFRRVPGSEFIKTMEQAYGIKYYRQGSNMHFYPVADYGVQVIRFPFIAPGKMQQMIRSGPLASPDLPMSYNAHSETLTISGPTSYRMTALAYFNNMNEAEKSVRVMEVFPLKYAWAGDVQIANINDNASIPGIASVLREMTGYAPQQAPQAVLPTAGSMTPMLPAGVAVPVPAQVPTTAGGLGQEFNAAAPIIVADPRQNAVIITDYSYKMPIYKSIIDKLDVAPQLVQIEVSIVDVDVNSQLNFGVNWSVNHGTGGGTGGTSGNVGSTSAMDSGLNLTAIYTKGVNTFIATAKALESQGNSKILGRPSLLTMNNIQATLESTNTFYVRTVGQDVAQLFDVTYGTVLQVTPSIVNEKHGRQIRLQIHVKDGSENSQASGADDIPVVKETSINTQGVVREGQSLLIGGYYYMESSTSKSGIPVLMDLPAVGGLFSSNKDTSRTMQRLILITPKIVELGDVTGADSQQLLNSLSTPSA